jgi:predicted dehydrogenase
MAGTINVALIGSKFMGRAHSNAWLNVAKFFDVDPHRDAHGGGAIGRRPRGVLPAVGLAAHLDRLGGGGAVPDVQLVDVATPNDVHAEQAIAALEAGKHVACEKPLAGTLADAQRMADAAAGSAGQTFVWFNYRRVPAVALAQRLVASGALGPDLPRPRAYLQSWGGTRTLPCCGGSRATSPAQGRTATSTPTSSTWSASSPARRS